MSSGRNEPHLAILNFPFCLAAHAAQQGLGVRMQMASGQSENLWVIQPWAQDFCPKQQCCKSLSLSHEL